ncbi:MAG TPA: Ada metal-binding domain-containing protein [Chryseosolibacter sp.]|nr:Ada metal-binding domain-containing protein [Chryseosolibacter sp.]
MMRINNSSEFKRLVRAGEIRFAGNKKLKIYGTLHCASGKRMKRSNRVFFSSEKDAESSGFRPCGKCLPKEYQFWKAGPSASSGTGGFGG